MDGGAWWDAVHGVARSQTWLSNFTFTFHFHALEKEMATHSSVLAWRIPGTGEPGGLTSMGSHRVGHDWSDLAAATAGLLASLTSCLLMDNHWKSLWNRCLGPFSTFNPWGLMNRMLNIRYQRILEKLKRATQILRILLYKNLMKLISAPGLNRALPRWR